MKKKYRLRVPSIPYRPGFEFSVICHIRCVPHIVDSDGYFHGLIVAGEEKEDEEYINETPCYFCERSQDE